MIAAVLLVLLHGSLVWAQVNPLNEYQLKAAFLFNFAKFVDWPPSTFSDVQSPINLCILGDDPFGDALDELVHGKIINAREIAIRRTRKVEELKACHVVFISDSEDRRLPDIFDDLKASSALTVGESPEFAERGGGIQFYMDEGRVRFSINVDAVRRAHVTVSSKLLALARIVHDKNHSSGD